MLSNFVYLALIGGALASASDEIWQTDGATDQQPGDRDLLSPLLQFNPHSRFLGEIESVNNVVKPPTLNPDLFDINASFRYRPSREPVEDAALPSNIAAQLPNDQQLTGSLPYLIPREAVEDNALAQSPQAFESMNNHNTNHRIGHNLRREPVEDSGTPEAHDVLDSYSRGTSISNTPPCFNPYRWNPYGVRREAVENAVISPRSDHIVMLPRTTMTLLLSNPPTLDSNSGPQKEPTEDEVPQALTSQETLHQTMGTSAPIPIARMPNRMHREAVEDILLPISNEALGLPRTTVYNQQHLLDNARMPRALRREAVEDIALSLTTQPTESLNNIPILNVPSSLISTSSIRLVNTPTEPLALGI